MTMLAYNNDQTIKYRCINRVRAHRLVGELYQLVCHEDYTIVCTFDHTVGLIEIGFPIQLVNLEKAIFKGLPTDTAKLWPEKLLSAVSVGADLKTIHHRFITWLLSDYDHPSIQEVVKLLQAVINGVEVSDKQWSKAAVNARAAARANSPGAACAASAAVFGYADCVDAASRSYPEMADKLIELLEVAC